MPVKSPFPDILIPDKSVSDLVLERISQYGEDIALIDNVLEGKSLTFKQAYHQIRSCAGFLHKHGLRKGDVVGLCGPTCVEFPVVMFGILAAGGVVTPCNPAYSKSEILQQFTITEPKMVFVHDAALDVMKSVARELTSIEKIFVIGTSEEFSTLDEIFGPKHEKDFPQGLTVSPNEDLAFLTYSSGTTGMPKSVMLTHKNIVSMSLIGGELTGYIREDCFYTDRPMYVGGFGLAMFSFLYGFKLIIDQEFVLERTLETVQKYKVTHLISGPPILIEMAKNDGFDKYDTSSLKQIPCAGSALAAPIINSLKKRYNVQIVTMYGMTECNPISANNNVDRFLTSVGLVAPNTEVKIVDLGTGAELSANEDGEILARGPQMMKGYAKNPDATGQTMDSDGWIHTGDIGRFDDHGMLYIIDRLKEVIKYKTFQVPPAEVESVILKHSKVADVGVTGVPDSSAGEIPKAFVVRKDDSLSEAEIMNFVEGELADHKRLRGGVKFVEVIPRSSMGKILRRELKKMS